jgi:hypothetical protein
MIGPARKRDVTIANRHPVMPRSRLGILPMTAAERQARRRARLRCHPPDTAGAPAQRRRPRPQRWAAAVAALLALQDEYRAWLGNLPENLSTSRLADKLEVIAALDLEELSAIDPPRGYGRD